METKETKNTPSKGHQKTGIMVIACLLVILTGVAAMKTLGASKTAPAQKETMEKSLVVTTIPVLKQKTQVSAIGYGQAYLVHGQEICPRVSGIIVEKSKALAKAAFSRLKHLYETDRVGTLSAVEQAEQSYNSLLDTEKNLIKSIALYPLQIIEPQNNLSEAQTLVSANFWAQLSCGVGDIHKFFIIAFKFKAMIIIHHHAEFSPKSAEGSFPPAKSSFITAWTSSKGSADLAPQSMQFTFAQYFTKSFIRLKYF